MQDLKLKRKKSLKHQKGAYGKNKDYLSVGHGAVKEHKLYGEGVKNSI